MSYDVWLLLWPLTRAWCKHLWKQLHWTYWIHVLLNEAIQSQMQPQIYEYNLCVVLTKRSLFSAFPSPSPSHPHPVFLSHLFHFIIGFSVALIALVMLTRCFYFENMPRKKSYFIVTWQVISESPSPLWWWTPKYTDPPYNSKKKKKKEHSNG